MIKLHPVFRNLKDVERNARYTDGLLKLFPGPKDYPEKTIDLIDDKTRPREASGHRRQIYFSYRIPKPNK